MSEKEVFNSFTVKHLRNMLSVLGEKTTGNKNELILRLLEFPESNQSLIVQIKKHAAAEAENVASDSEVEIVSTKSRGYGVAETEKMRDAVEEIEMYGKFANETNTMEIEMYKNVEQMSATKNEIQKCVENLKGKTSETYDSEIQKFEKESNEREFNQTNSNKKNTQKIEENEISSKEYYLMKKEMEIMMRELEIQKKEMEVLKMENNVLKNQNKESNNIEKNTFKGNFSLARDLLSDFTGNGDNFELWSSQLMNIKIAYNLDDLMIAMEGIASDS